MPLVRRPAYGWQDAAAGAERRPAQPNLPASYPNELPNPDPQITPALQAASLPPLSAQPGTSPVRGRPRPQQLGLAPGVAATGEPSAGASRSSIFMQSTY
jgi:hypothetical protein